MKVTENNDGTLEVAFATRDEVRRIDRALKVRGVTLEGLVNATLKNYLDEHDRKLAPPVGSGDTPGKITIEIPPASLAVLKNRLALLEMPESEFARQAKELVLDLVENDSGDLAGCYAYPNRKTAVRVATRLFAKERSGRHELFYLNRKGESIGEIFQRKGWLARLRAQSPYAAKGFESEKATIIDVPMPAERAAAA